MEVHAMEDQIIQLEMEIMEVVAEVVLMEILEHNHSEE